MLNTTASAEQFCRDFAAEFPTPNVLRAIELVEAGRLTWEQIAGLFGRSLESGLLAVLA